MAEVRQRWLDALPRMVCRPGMYSHDGFAFDLLARGLLEELCFLDERESDLDDARAELRRFGKTGVAGPFKALFGDERGCVAEVASVFSALFHRLGYLDLDRLLDTDEWSLLTTGLRERFDGRDVRLSEVETWFGSPSLLIDQRIACYAPADRSGWVYFDCFAEHRTDYVPGEGHYEWHQDADPLVRMVRQPAADFEGGLTLTLYGKVLRWGPGWWLRHDTGLSEEQRAIARQLRMIEAADPSQALRPERGVPRH
ncbi:hypothetical protein Athai_16020 [Actinocatenispora thailandica]|uniref:Uncharacterized protein n=1 Tax=Actinocatenispora thailandica TaxID=227318 RepID=A0A7R7HWL4_9ACTN|nr:hypothetical protein Athai_16020 [Actinocatenispora thailandica]